MVNQIREVVLTYLDIMAREITAFAREEDIWRTDGSVTNSAGTLALHLVGSMNHFIGATLGGTGYVRDRASEFSLRDVPRQVLLTNITDVRETVEATMRSLSMSAFELPYPLANFGENKTTGDVLIILCSHAAYHSGQVNYIRRLMDGRAHG